MTTRTRWLCTLLIGVLPLGASSALDAAELSESRMYIEYNHSANDLGFHVSLDGEDWTSLKIINPNNRVTFEVQGRAGYSDLGLTELFFEGAEPNLSEFPLEELLALFPEGTYRFSGTTVDGEAITGTAILSHAVPDAPVAWAIVKNGSVTIAWNPVTGPAAITPGRDIQIEGYQVLVEDLDIIVDEETTRLTLPREFVRGLDPGVIQFEVLAIDVNGNQTITEGSFNLK